MVGKQQVESIGRAMTGAWTAFLVANLKAASDLVGANVGGMSMTERAVWIVLVAWTVFWGTVYWYAANWEGRWFLDYPPKALGPVEMLSPVILMISFAVMPIIVASLATRDRVAGMRWFLLFCTANQFVDLIGRYITRKLFLKANLNRMSAGEPITNDSSSQVEVRECSNFARYLFDKQHFYRPALKLLLLVAALIVHWFLAPHLIVDICAVSLLVLMTFATEVWVWRLRERVERHDNLHIPPALTRAIERLKSNPSQDRPLQNAA